MKIGNGKIDKIIDFFFIPIFIDVPKIRPIRIIKVTAKIDCTTFEKNDPITIAMKKKAIPRERALNLVIRFGFLLTFLPLSNPYL